jgi:hypothetical protein
VFFVLVSRPCRPSLSPVLVARPCRPSSSPVLVARPRRPSSSSSPVLVARPRPCRPSSSPVLVLVARPRPCFPLFDVVHRCRSEQPLQCGRKSAVRALCGRTRRRTRTPFGQHAVPAAVSIEKASSTHRAREGCPGTRGQDTQAASRARELTLRRRRDDSDAKDEAGDKDGRQGRETRTGDRRKTPVP